MILTHFAKANVFVFDPNRTYDHRRPPLIINGKPSGLWLSDESEDAHGWGKWLDEEGYCRDYKNIIQFEVDMSRILYVDKDNIDGLNLPYSKSNEHYPWHLIAEKWGGIFVRHTFELWAEHSHPKLDNNWWGEDLGIRKWLYAWDCDSACVWDLSCVKEVK